MDGQLFGFEYDLVVTEMGLLVAGIAAVIGIWVERDPDKPKRYSIWLTVLIVLATFVGMFQTYDDDQDQKKVEADLARVLQTLDKIANESDVDLPELNDLIKNELAAQSRSNPGVVQSFAQRLADDGQDPGDVMRTYLPESEVQGLARKQSIKPKANVSAGNASGAQLATRSSEGAAAGSPARRRRVLSFGGGPAKLRATAEAAAAPAKPKEEAPVAAATAEPEAAPTAVPTAIPTAAAAAVLAGGASGGALAGLKGIGGPKPSATAPKPAAPGAPKPNLGGVGLRR
jgi:hypothetical protein